MGSERFNLPKVVTNMVQASRNDERNQIITSHSDQQKDRQYIL